MWNLSGVIQIKDLTSPYFIMPHLTLARPILSQWHLSLISFHLALLCITLPKCPLPYLPHLTLANLTLPFFNLIVPHLTYNLTLPLSLSYSTGRKAFRSDRSDPSRILVASAATVRRLYLGGLRPSVACGWSMFSWEENETSLETVCINNYYYICTADLQQPQPNIT